MKYSVIALVAAATVLAVPAATAKPFPPGGLLVCGRAKCVPIMDKKLLRLLTSYYWGPMRMTRVPRVRNGAQGFELRFGRDYTSAMVARRGLDRFRAYGFNCGRFVRGKWYLFPRRAAAALRKLTAGLRPLRVTAPPPSC